MKIIDDPNPTMGDIMPVIVDNYHAANECKDHYGQLMDFYNNERNEINKAIK